MISKKIKEIRLAASLSQSEFGKRLGITKAAVSSMENGHIYPSYPLLKKIVEEFKVDGRWLLPSKE